MLQEYHTTLCDTLNAMGYSKKFITLEALTKDYDEKAVCGLYGACCALPVVLADKGVELDSLLESGGGHNPEVHSGEFYKKALQRMVPEFDEKGAFRC
jgi:hypothetical protein